MIFQHSLILYYQYSKSFKHCNSLVVFLSIWWSNLLILKTKYCIIHKQVQKLPPAFLEAHHIRGRKWRSLRNEVVCLPVRVSTQSLNVVFVKDGRCHIYVIKPISSYLILHNCSIRKSNLSLKKNIMLYNIPVFLLTPRR